MSGLDPRKEARPPLWLAIGSIVLYIGLQLLAGIIAQIIGMARNPTLAAKVEAKVPGALQQLLRESAVELIGGIIVASLIMMALIFVYTKTRRPPLVLGLKRGSALTLINTIKTICIGIGVSLLFVAVWAFFLGQWKGADFDPQPEIRETVKNIPQTLLSMGIVASAITFFGPLIEEVMFRGLLQNAFKKHMGAAFAILISAALFGASHMQPYAFPALFFLGAGLGWIYHRTGSLLLVFLLHFANNVIALSVSGL